MTIFWQDWQQIIPSVWTSIYIALLAILFGIPIGCLIAWIRVKRPPILNQLVGIYLSFARSVPNDRYPLLFCTCIAEPLRLC